MPLVVPLIQAVGFNRGLPSIGCAGRIRVVGTAIFQLAATVAGLRAIVGWGLGFSNLPQPVVVRGLPVLTSNKENWPRGSHDGNSEITN